MKTNTHPNYYTKCQVSCVCGNTFTTGSTMPEIKVELCSQCHPFYTGKQKLVDTARRVEKYQEKVGKQSDVAKTRRGKTAKRAARAEARSKREVVVKAEKLEDLKAKSKAKAKSKSKAKAKKGK